MMKLHNVPRKKNFWNGIYDEMNKHLERIDWENDIVRETVETM